MKKSQLQQLVKEIISQTMQEMRSHGTDWTVTGNDITLENIQLDDGRLLGAEVTGQFTKTNSGIGSYEFWGHKGYDKGEDSYLLEGWTITHAWIHDENGKVIQEINLKDPASKPIIDEIEHVMETNQEAIQTYYNENPPEPYHPGEED